MIVITVFGATVGVWCERAERQRRVCDALEDLGCDCDFYDEPDWLEYLPESLREFRGGHYWRTVYYVQSPAPGDPFGEDRREIANRDWLPHCQQLSVRNLCVYIPLAEGDLELIASIPGLQSLDFTASSFREADIPHLRKLSRIQEVSCDLENVEGDIESVRILGELTSATTLRIDYCNDEGLKYLAPLVRLELLEIYDGDLADGDFGALRKAPLRELGLGTCWLSDQGGASLSHIPSLERVNLVDELVGNDTARALAKLPKLQSLWLNGTLVDDEGAAALAESTSLEELGISSTSIGPKGMAALAKSSSPKSIQVWNMSISREELAAFGSSPVLQRLDAGEGNTVLLPRARMLELATEPPDAGEREALWLSPEELLESVQVDARNCGPLFKPYDDDRLKLLADVPQVTSLDLSCSIVTDAGLVSVATMRSLRSIDCSETSVSTAGLRHLLALPGLRTLDLKNCRGVDDSAINVLCEMPALELVNLEGTNISREGMIRLAKSKELWRLASNFGRMENQTPDSSMALYMGLPFAQRNDDVDGEHLSADAFLVRQAQRTLLLPNDAPLTDAEVAHLAEATELVRLRAEMNDKQFESLRDLEMLEEIELIGPSVGRQSLRSALQRPNLIRLSLNRVRLASDDWSELRGTTIYSIVLEDVDVSDGWLDALPTMPDLRGVTLKGSAVSDESVTRVSENCPGLTEFSLDAKRCSPQIVLQAIRRLGNLRSLDLGEGGLEPGRVAMLRGQHAYDAYAKENLAYPTRDEPQQKFETLEGDINLSGRWVDDSIGLPNGNDFLMSRVALRNSRITGATIERLAKYGELESLDLSGSIIRDSDMAAIGKPTHLYGLELSDCAIGGETVRRFLGCRKLDTLNLARTQVDDEALATVAAWRRLRTLYLTGTSVTDLGMKSLGAAKSLHELGLSGTQITDAGLKQLGGLKQLHTLGLSNTAVGDEGVATIGSLLRLQHVDLRDTKVTDEGITRLAALRRAEVIDLRGTQVSPEGVAKLRRALPWCRVVLTEEDSVMLREKKLEGSIH